jgi:hypothetical protein
MAGVPRKPKPAAAPAAAAAPVVPENIAPTAPAVEPEIVAPAGAPFAPEQGVIKIEAGSIDSAYITVGSLAVSQIQPTGIAAGALVEVRVTREHADFAIDQVVEIPEADIEDALAAGWIDPHPDAVAYARSLEH